MSPRESRRWLPRRALLALAGVAVLSISVIAGVIAWDRHEERGATERSCAALQAPVEGLGVLTWNNGSTMTEGNWSAVLLDWHDHLDESEKARTTEAVRADDQGFNRLLGNVEEVIRPDIEVLVDRVVPLTSPDHRDLDVSPHVDALQRYLIETCHIAP